MPIIAPAAPGSHGDEAMMAGLVSRLSQGGFTPLYIGPAWSSHLGVGRDMAPILRKLGPLGHLLVMRRAHTLYCVGADILDGGYASSIATLRLNLCRLAARCGVPTRIVSFSFNDHPTQIVLDGFRRLPPVVALVARDELSRTRLESALDNEVELGADLAYLGEAAELAVNLPSGTLVGFSPNKLLADHVGGENTYIAAVQRAASALTARDPARHLVLISHDVRSSSDDRRVCDGIAVGLDSTRVTVVHPRDYAEARSVFRHLDLLVTGRMHAAIGALSEGVPVLVFDYQGKVEGALAHFGLADRRLRPDDILDTENLIAAIEAELVATAETRERINAALPRVRQLAMRNFDHVHVRTRSAA